MPRLLLMLIICAPLLSLGSPVFACSGGGYWPSVEDIAFDDIIVAATVVDVDDVGIGKILKVDRYFKGEGGEFLVQMLYPPALQVATHVRRYDTGCLNDARPEKPRRIDDFGYLGLSANGNGTFSIGSIYTPKRGVVEFYSENSGVVTLPVHEFEQLLLNLSGQSETTEPQSNPYPLMRFLNITTESGRRYRLNPDRSLTWLDPTVYPSAISKDGSHVVFRLDDGKLGIQYLSTVKKPIVPWLQAEENAASTSGSHDSAAVLAYYGWLHPVHGLYARFAPNSNFIAVQEDTRLVVYLLHSVEKKGAIVGYAHRLAVREIAGFDLSWQNAEEQQPLVWSADSRAIAYQDSHGIWLWTFIERAKPQLMVQAREGQEILDLSASGRYLRFGRPADWTLLDVQSGDTWKDALITPDESRFIHIFSDRAADYVDRRKLLSECSLPLISCPIVLIQSPHTGVGSGKLPQDVFWHEPDLLGLVYRDAFQSIRWSYALEWAFCELRICHGLRLPSLNAFAYDAHYDQPAFAFDETKIGFGLRENDNYYDSVDLSDHLDSPIAEIEWGQPIFYEGH